MRFLLPFLFACQALGASVYVSTNGNDGTAVRGDPAHPALTLTNAVSMALAGDTISMGAGTFPLGSDVIYLGNVTLLGSGRDRTTITGGGNGLRIIILTNSVTLSSFTLTSTNSSGAYVYPIYTTPYLDSVVASITMTNIAVNGYSDNVSINSTNIVNCRVDNCTFYSVYDTFLIYNFQPLSTYQLNGCSFSVEADLFLWGDEMRCMVINGGPQVAVTGCRFSASNAVDRTYCIYNVLGNLTLRSSSMKAVSSSGGIYAIDQEGGSSTVYGATLDAAKLNIVGGTISYVATPTERYVSTAGNNSDGGTATAPWATVGKAAASATSGQVVNVGPGIYNEFVTNLVSGTLASPITFNGAPDYSAVIDPSTALSTGWVLDGTMSNGVYSNTAPWQTYELELDGKQVMYVYSTGNISTALTTGWPTISLTTGAQLLSSASSFSVTPYYNNVAVPFWDGVEALWSSASDHTVWLRLRDGSNPNGRNIRVAPNGSPAGVLRTEELLYPAIHVSASNLVWQGFLVRGARGQILLDGTAAKNVTIRSNYLSGGVQRILAQNGCSSNVISGNVFASDYYGGTNIGAWTGQHTATYARRESAYYQLLKYLMGNGGSLNYDLHGKYIGAGNVIAGNTLLPGAVGIEIEGDVANPTFYLTIASNSISSHASLAVALHDGVTQASVFENTLIDNNLSIREHDMGATGETNRVHYIYRNRSWQPDSAGEHVYFYWVGQIPGGNYHPEIWIYHNSFAGGSYAVDLADELTWNDGGAQKVRCVNNLADQNFIYTYDPFKSNASAMKADYNLKLVTPYYNGAYEGSHTLTNNATEWPLGIIPNWSLKSGSLARDAALDVTVPFTLQGTSFPALPLTGTKFGSAWDIGAVESGSSLRIVNLVVNALNVRQ